MILKKYKSPGLAHLSYLIGSGQEAAVIDPRRDCHAYVEKAHREGMRITHIFETHRNEDYAIGSLELQSLTGAKIYHGEGMDFAYGNSVKDNDRFEIGNLTFKSLQTPGHTMESISIAVCDPAFNPDEAVAVFTGDALFIGDVGRTDFFPDRKREVAEMLFESIHEKLMFLGDQAILCPAHGAGSVCGSGMAKREFSTLGYERHNNPRLQLNRSEFVDFKVNENHYQPAYFKKMEEWNKNGTPALGRVPEPAPMDAETFSDAMSQGMIALDVRSPEAFAGCHIPGSYCIPENMVPAFAGYFLPYDTEIGIIAPDYDTAMRTMTHLVRIAYDNVHGVMIEAMKKWETSGRQYDSVGTLYAGDMQEWIDSGKEFTLLDVRSIDEYEEDHLPDAKHMYVGYMEEKVDGLDIPKDQPIVTFCGSGRRAIIAASILKRHGFTNVYDSLGSMDACRALGCEMAESAV